VGGGGETDGASADHHYGKIFRRALEMGDAPVGRCIHFMLVRVHTLDSRSRNLGAHRRRSIEETVATWKGRKT